MILLLVLITSALASPTVYLDERFDDGDSWKERWVQSNHEHPQGKVQVGHGDFYADPEIDKGLQPMESFRYYQLSRKLDVPFNTLGKSLVLQYSVKNQRNINCAGAYIKLLPAGTNLSEFNSKTPYHIMFGPDICGIELRVIRAIIRRDGKEFTLKKPLTCEDDEYTHFYTLIIHPNQTYEIRVDNRVRMAGNIIDDFDLHIPYMVRNYKTRKPSDWDDRIFLRNKSAPLDNGKSYVEEDIKFETMYNSKHRYDETEFVGRAPQGYIRNRNYRGRWQRPYIIKRNGGEKNLQLDHGSIGAVGFDLWIITPEIVFDNILITDDTNHVFKFDEDNFMRLREIEKNMKERMDVQKRIKRNIRDRKNAEKRRQAELKKHRKLVDEINAEILEHDSTDKPANASDDHSAKDKEKTEL
ncbi:calreticulin [Trichuris trichiura]|uniref:Calreticulin n=1 Tax=Trichuris trichiura TaxID=36087 RepID=A0A077ZB14_TRITR|nr:calreticulin [Trichuris trichiura]